MKNIIKRIFIKQTDNLFLQIIRYTIGGFLATVIEILSLYLLKEVFGLYYIIANVIGFLIGLYVRYIISKKIVFKVNNNISPQIDFIIFGIIGVIGLILDSTLVWIFTEKCKMYYLLSKIVATILVFTWNFTARKIQYAILNLKSQ